MAVSMRFLLAATMVWTATARGQSSPKGPHIGYVYPAGGQRATTFEITVGGQFLKDVSDVYVSGTGIRGSIVQHYRPLNNLSKEQRQQLQRLLKELTEKRLAESSIKDRSLGPPKQEPIRPKKNADKSRAKAKETTPSSEPADLPEHPLLRNLESKSLRELQHIRDEFFNAKRRQPNAQIAESVVIEITIAANAVSGDREIRLGTPAGLTNPMRFQVGSLPETREQEPNDPRVYPMLPDEPPLNLPVLINGQIMPGDIDRFRFQAHKGQKLVIEARGRSLVPYLADAVPGWFQATLALYDPRGNQLDFADSYRFDPDPVLFFEVPKDGQYALEVRDSIYRGREDFVYRVAVGEQPFITQAFPLGGRAGVKTVAAIDGWNLFSKRLLLGTPPGVRSIRQTVLRRSDQISNPVTYAVDLLPEERETEPNDTPQNAQQIDLPRVVNGCIAQPGDQDVYRFQGRAGDKVVAEVYARRLNSLLDSLLRLTDGSGRVLEWNDDHEDQESGLLTHHADSYLRARLPEDGTYYVCLTDAQHHGGETCGYRLRISAPRPDFGLRVTPASVNLRAGGSVPLSVHAVRKDGFDGDIEVVVKDASAGFTIDGGRIPRGRDRVRMTLTAPLKPLDKPIVLQLEGRAGIGGQTIRRPVVPAEDMMQAFLYRHLVPFQDLMVAVLGKRPMPPVELTGDGPVRLPAGGTAQVRIRTAKRPQLRDIRLELSEPPAGVTLGNVTLVPEGLVFVLKADRDTAKVGYADNLIVEAFAEPLARQPGGKGQKQRFSLGVLPAIPFEIVQP